MTARNAVADGIATATEHADGDDRPAGRPGAGRLVRRVRECHRFATHAVEIADRSHPLWDVQLGDVTGLDKLLLEASLFAELTARDPRFATEAAALLAAVRARVVSEPLLHTLRRQPAQVTTLGATLLVLDRFGMTTGTEHEVLRAALDCGYVESGERVPFRLLDRQWVLHLAGRGPLLDASALATSAACRPMHPVYMTREDAYAITHTVMYATDFGAAPVPGPLRTAELADTLDACLIWQAAARDYDLVAELLLAQVLVAGRLSPVGAVAWQDAVRVWDGFGFLPGPSLSATAFAEQRQERDRTQYAVHHMYHTVLVAGLLCAALAGAGRHSRATVPQASDGSRGSAIAADRAAIRAGSSLARRFVAGVFLLDAETAAAIVRALPWTGRTDRYEELMQRWGPLAEDQVIAERMARSAAVIECARDYDLAGLIAALRGATATTGIDGTVLAGAGLLVRQLPDGTALEDLAPDERVRLAGIAAAIGGCLDAVLAADARGGVADG